MSGTIWYTTIPDGFSSPIQQRASVSASSDRPDPTISATRTVASARPLTAPDQSRPALGDVSAPGGVAPAARGAAAAMANSSAGIRNSNVTPENDSTDPTAQATAAAARSDRRPAQAPRPPITAGSA